MGTNYYAHWRPPGSCTTVVELHICKSHYMFQGAVFPSWQQWKQWLVYQDEAASIVDEYGDKHELGQFILDVEATPHDGRRKQTQWIKDHPEYDYGRDWWDADGFSFHRGEFS